MYASTQELYKHNPSLLAKHIREGVTWLENSVLNVPQEDIHKLYTELWGSRANVVVPFKSSTPVEDQSDISAYNAITTQELKTRINRRKMETSPGPDGFGKKHNSTIRERPFGFYSTSYWSGENSPRHGA